ncbi:MAG TPA: nucleoside-triphosphatase [Candidatus Saccharicenans sp.]|jgi:nucleoside-triphosphatase THEP1|nr:nucleoside-triphosphatase [Candidatus Saccharicenans sp.]HPU94053.1 nucleoside-triphosphatase [Candidatus Saccharicenans sp.]
MIFVVTGPVGAGKTTLVKLLVNSLKQTGLRLAGYVSEAVRLKGETTGYDLFELNSSRRLPFLRKAGINGQLMGAGQFYFLPSGLKAARDIIRSALHSDLLVVDEIGPAEIRGDGVWPDLYPLLNKINCLLVIREKLLADFLPCLPPPVMFFRAEAKEQPIEPIADYIFSMLKSSRLKKSPN